MIDELLSVIYCLKSNGICPWATFNLNLLSNSANA